MLLKISILLNERPRVVLLFRLSDLYHLPREAVVPILYFKQIFVLPLPFFPSAKTWKSMQFGNVIQSYTRACSSCKVHRISPLPSDDRRLFFLACNVLWSRSFIGTSDRVKWHLLIAKGFVFKASSQSLKRIPTPVHWFTIWGYWNFRLEFVMPLHIITHTRRT